VNGTNLANLNIASNLLVGENFLDFFFETADAHGANDIMTDLAFYQTSLRAAEHLKLFYLESRKFQTISTNGKNFPRIFI
jgi:hypothetical protein